MAMLSRRKKMRFNPDDRFKSGRVTKRAEQIFLSRRILLARSAIVAGFSVLATRLGYMQLVQGDKFQAQARSNTTDERTIKAPRGLIFDSKGRMLADNEKSWEIRVIPDLLPTDEVSRRRVLDQVISALSLPDVLVLDPEAIPTGNEQEVHNKIVGSMIAMDMLSDVPPEVEEGEAAIPSDAEIKLESLKVESARQYVVLVYNPLTLDQAAQFRAITGQVPGLTVMNYLEYLIANAGNTEQPIPVKTGLPKDLALKLEANKHLLPGIELDDSVLIRRYHGGEVMSHVLGYARRITTEFYEDHEDEVYDNSDIKVYDRDDIVGQDGIELKLDALLRGRKGRELVEVDGRMVVQQVLNRADPIPGRSLRLTIDMELQDAISEIMKRGVDFANEDRKAKNKVFKEPAQSGAVVATNPKNGDVLAMVSFPHYDNQLFVDGISDRQYKEYTDKKVGAPLFNRAIAGEFPCGSTIKPFLAVTALREDKISPDKTFSCKGGITIPFEFDQARGSDHPCWLRDGGHGDLTVIDAIERSCDVFFYNVGAPKDKLEGSKDFLHYYDQSWASLPNNRFEKRQRGDKHYFEGLGIDAIHTGMTKRFWFGANTNIDLPGEYPGVIPTPASANEDDPDFNWSVSATVNVSIGQGRLKMTPLQLALNTAAIANRGTVWKPRLVKAVLDESGEVESKPKAEKLRKMKVSGDDFDISREGMRRVVHEDSGSAHHDTLEDGNFTKVSKWLWTNPAGEDEILLGGKTGTAEIGEPNDEGIYERQHAWFTCFAPYDDPEIALTVLVEDGGEGSLYAVPLADRILRAYFETTGRRDRGKILKKDGDGLADIENLFPDPGVTQDSAQD